MGESGVAEAEDEAPENNSERATASRCGSVSLRRPAKEDDSLRS